MASRKRNELYRIFSTGKKPTQDDFTDLIDSALNVEDDGIGASEKGKPMEIVAQGTRRRFLDFSNEKDTPVWRMGALSEDAQREGFNLSSNNSERLFIKKENGFTGIGNENPQAKLHITSDSGNALRVDDRTGSASVVVNSKGNVGIGAEASETNRLSVEGSVELAGDVAISGGIDADNGMVVKGARLNAQQGVTVKGGAVIQTGTLDAKNGAIVGGGALEANSGMFVRGGALAAEDGLTVTGGATIESGALAARAGAVVTGDELRVEKGLTVDGEQLKALSGAVVSGSELEAQNGLSVRGSELKAQAGATVSGSELKAENGAVVSGSELIAKNGATVTGSELKALEGIVVRGGELKAENGAAVLGAELRVEEGAVIRGSELRVEKGMHVSGSELVAASGVRVVGSGLVAEAGATISGSELRAEDGLVVGGAHLIAEEGLIVRGQELEAQSGATVSGAPLKSESGLIVGGNLRALDTAEFGNATINKLTVSDTLSAQGISLQSAALANLEADNAVIANLNANGSMEVGGAFSVSNSVTLGGGKLYVTYEGRENVSPSVKVVEGLVDKGTGHFNIDIDVDKLLTVTYDEKSNIENFIDDWDIFKRSNAEKSEGFQITREGTGAWKIQDAEIEMFSTGNGFKEFRVAENGLRVLYTGSETGTPSVVVEENDNGNDLEFDFVVDGLVLTIKTPVSEYYRTVEYLLKSWSKWRKTHEEDALRFEIQQTGDSKWLVDDVSAAENLIASGEVIREFSSGELCVTHQEASNAPVTARVAVNSSGQGASVNISAYYDTLSLSLGAVENSPKAVFEAWEEYKASGKNTFGFDIKESSDTTPVNVVEEKGLTIIDATHSEVYFSNYSVSFEGANAREARVLLEMGTAGFEVTAAAGTPLLTIRYPKRAAERTVSNLMAAWASVAEKHGFEILKTPNSLTDEFQVTQQASMDHMVADIKVYDTTSAGGVDGFRVSCTGPESDQPALTIKPGPRGENRFGVAVDENAKTIHIKYPEDKSGTVDQLLACWNTLSTAEKGNFELEKLDILQAGVFDASGNLAVNPANHLFSKGIIRTNIVTLDGGLRFSDSDIVIGNFSDSDSLQENSGSIVPTQKAVKAYVDSYVELLDNEKADKSATQAALDGKADKAATETALNLKADKTAIESKADKAATETALNSKADKAAIDAKADKAATETALASKADKAATETALASKADKAATETALDSKANKVATETALDSKADNQAMATALSGKANVSMPADISIAAASGELIHGLDLSDSSRGMLMISIADQQSGTSRGSGLFAVYGKSGVSKISGDLFSDTRGGGTCNVYYDAASLMIENTSASDAIAATLTYFGA